MARALVHSIARDCFEPSIMLLRGCAEITDMDWLACRRLNHDIIGTVGGIEDTLRVS